MIRLLKIDLAKLLGYRTFWVLLGIYLSILILIPLGGMETLKWLASKGAEFGQIDIMKIPLYHFPDIWQNLTYVAKFITLIAGILIIVLITNEFSYKTVRQNVIDGMSRADFIASKVVFIIGLSLLSTIIVLTIGLIMGSIYSPESEMRFMFKNSGFIPAFFLFTVNFFLFSMLVGFVIKRAGLSIVILLVYPLFEVILRNSLPGSAENIVDYFPFWAITNLIDFPFTRYALQEIRDVVAMKDVLINLAYAPLLVFLSYKTIAKKNLS